MYECLFCKCVTSTYAIEIKHLKLKIIQFRQYDTLCSRAQMNMQHLNKMLCSTIYLDAIWHTYVAICMQKWQVENKIFVKPMLAITVAAA